MELFAPGDRRDGDDDSPGADGSYGNPTPLAKYILHIPIWVQGASRGERNDNLRTIGSYIGGAANGGLVTLERRIATGSGSGHVSHTANGRFVTGLSPSIINHLTGKTELQFYNLDGRWFDGSVHIYP